ncbi:zinc finger protein 709-like isoform X2 [Dysidea avara]|uniref:zinc finger protein 709-like isoform X2 n=1 Tax=Dysidea avara TaxID=196820 RepID=UPI00331DF541
MLGRAQNTGTRKRTRERFDINSVTAPAMKKFRRCKETKRGAIIYKDWSPSVVVRRLPASSVEGRCCGKITVEDKRKPQMNTAPKKKCVNPLTSVTSKPQHTSGPLSSGNQKDVVSEITSPVQGPTVDTNHRKSTRLAKMIPNYYGDLVILDDDIEFDDEGITNGVSNKIVKGDDDDDDDDYHGSNHDDDDIDVEGVSDDDDIDVETVSDDDDVETVSDHGNVDHSQVDHSQVDEHHNGIIGRNNDHDNDGDDKDDIIFCEDCHAPYHGDCPVHGPLIPLDESRGWDQDSKSFTSVPVPLQVTVKMSSIMNAGKGVFAKEFIPRRTRIGPYKGEVVQKEDITDKTDTSYFWEVTKNGSESYYIDAKNEKHSNWLRFINCARNESEQNLLSFQYKGNIYCYTIKSIPPGTELLVWYGEDYVKQQRLTVDHMFAPNFTCVYCRRQFIEKCNFVLHLKYSPVCRNANPALFKCGKCSEAFTTLINLQQHIRKHEENYYLISTGTQVVKHSSTSNALMKANLKASKKANLRASTKANSKASIKRASTKANLKASTKSNLRASTKANSKASTKVNLKASTKVNSKASANARKGVQKCEKKSPGSGVKEYICQYCSKKFVRKGSLRSHVRIHTGEKPYQCPYCDKTFAVTSNLHSHLIFHTGERSHQCSHCDKAFAHSSTLRSHIRTHTGEKPFVCKYCSKGFAQGSSLQSHLRTHTGEKPYQCKYCSKAFALRSNQSKHLRTHTGEKPYKCPLCNKAFTISTTLQIHLHSHTNKKSYQCEYCGKTFTQSIWLRLHVRTHTKDKRYSCPYCTIAFTDKSDLQTHLLTHGVKRHVCHVCGKRLSGTTSLKSHIRSHTGEKPFHCKVCGKAFSLNNSLKVHLRTHTGEKPFSCPYCIKKFAIKGNLQKHVRIHTGEKPYPCDLCGKAFAEKRYLKRHLEKHVDPKKQSKAKLYRNAGQKFIEKKSLMKLLKNRKKLSRAQLYRNAAKQVK